MWFVVTDSCKMPLQKIMVFTRNCSTQKLFLTFLFNFRTMEVWKSIKHVNHMYLSKFFFFYNYVYLAVLHMYAWKGRTPTVTSGDIFWALRTQWLHLHNEDIPLTAVLFRDGSGSRVRNYPEIFSQRWNSCLGCQPRCSAAEPWGI